MLALFPIGNAKTSNRGTSSGYRPHAPFFINQSGRLRGVYKPFCLTMKFKKLLQIAALAIAGLLPMAAEAQGFEWSMSPKYVGELHIGYKTTSKVSGMDTYSAWAELGTLQGVSFNQYLDVALGVDAIMLTHYYHGRGLRFGMKTYADFRPAYPITDSFKVFLDLGLGAVFNIYADPELGSAFYCQFGPGFRYRKLNFSLGLQSWGTGQGSCGFFTKVGLYF